MLLLLVAHKPSGDYSAIQQLELCGGLDALENLQSHANHTIYTKAVRSLRGRLIALSHHVLTLICSHCTVCTVEALRERR